MHLIPNSTFINDIITISSTIQLINDSTYINYNINQSDTIIGSKIKNEKRVEEYFNGTKKELLQNLTDIIQSIKIGENYTIIGNDFKLIIKPTNSTYNENNTHIDFKQCEDIIRENSNISNSRILTLVQLEIENRNEKSLVNQVEYQVYDDNKTILNLSLCNNTDIQIFYLFKDDSYNFPSNSYFKSSNINIFNINDSFFNDICQPYSDNDNDVVLSDRIKDIYQNYSLCDEGCFFQNINFENKTIVCDCKVKTNLSIEEPNLNLIYFDEIEIESNFGLIKCYKLVFAFKGKFNNIGFWIFSILVIVQIPFIFIFFCKELEKIRKYVINQMIKFGYIKKNKNKNNNI